MKKYLVSFLKKLLLKERSIPRLSASFCLGTFIALTPTIPLQTPLAVVLSWLFGLNVAVAVAALYVVNNPLTMIPIYVAGYALGVWCFKLVGATDLLQHNPVWVGRFNAFLSRYIDIKKYLGAEFCFWCLLLGGFLFALLVSVLLYPLLKKILTRLATQLEKEKKTA